MTVSSIKYPLKAQHMHRHSCCLPLLANPFLLTNHTLKTLEVLSVLRKGHDIQKWHSLWGNGLDVWPLNKVSSISSISKMFGVFGIAGLFIKPKPLNLSCVTAPSRLKRVHHMLHVPSWVLILLISIPHSSPKQFFSCSGEDCFRVKPQRPKQGQLTL